MEMMRVPQFIKSALGDSWWMPAAVFFSFFSIAFGWNVVRIFVLQLSKGWAIKSAIGIEILTALALINAFIAPLVSFWRGKFWKGYFQFVIAVGAFLIAKEICSFVMEKF